MSQERIEFENWLGIKPCGAAHDLAWAAWQARASLLTQPAAQAKRPQNCGTSYCSCIECVMEPAAQATPGHVPDAGKMIQATPEPVLLNGLTESETNATASVMGLTAEPDVPETDFGNMATQQATGEPFGYFRAMPFGWEQCSEHDDGAVALFTHQAPGVPEGFDVQALTATGGGHKYPLIVVRDKSSQLGEDVFPDEHPVIYGLLSALLAAAQAKGEE